MASIIDIKVCQLCFEDFDTDIARPDGDHRLPVTCNECPNTVCYQCYLNLQKNQSRNIHKHGGVRCPRCNTEKGFASENPAPNRALCLLLVETKALIARISTDKLTRTAEVKRASSPRVKERASSPPRETSLCEVPQARAAACFPTQKQYDDVSKNACHSPSRGPDVLGGTADDSRGELNATRSSSGSRRTEIRINKKGSPNTLAHPVNYLHLANPCGFGLD